MFFVLATGMMVEDLSYAHPPPYYLTAVPACCDAAAVCNNHGRSEMLDLVFYWFGSFGRARTVRQCNAMWFGMVVELFCELL